jgi:ATP-dependent Clp protease ATP-binding subunit ClpA
MLFRIPIYVAGAKPQGGGTTVHTARPLFVDGPTERGENLNRLLARLARKVGDELTRLGRADRHEELAAWSFCPELSQERADLTFLLRRRTARCRYLLVAFRQFDRRVAFTPSLPDVWFDVGRGETVAGRATEVLTRYWRDQEKEDGPEVRPESTSLEGTAWVTTLELDVRPPAKAAREEKPVFAFLGETGRTDGAAELRRVGRCLDWLYPDELDRVSLREPEVAELTRLLRSDDRRPVLLLGPRGVGKTALVHETVFRRVARRKSAYRDRRNCWLLAPQRLISGMSYVGQWENRLLAILREAKRRDHLLYFDELLGLFQAGVSACSSLNVAAVMKPYLERREVRVLGEITPEAYRVLREQDRGFADLFHLLPVREPTEEETWRILIGVQRQQEGRQRCRFDLEALPTVLDLQRRYARAEAFPGKAARFLRQLAVKHRGVGRPREGAADEKADPTAVTRAAVLAEFQAQSGLALPFLDTRVKLERRQVLEELRRHVIGQEAALEAVADVLAVAKARLNDPGRPLATLLFLGPTGVGKTECAKAVARYLFSDPERLLRFDLNEFNNPGAAAKLVGTFSQPEGLLTAAVRRQPFAVVLLDEVEKADPGVFDLLLQVLGEGRLTDALGRTADFTNAIVILTSNLGVREAEGRLGFRADEAGFAAEEERDARRHAEDTAVFVQAAERFFRPEFFNRLDRILPFRRLTRPQVRRIADRLVRDLFAREGFRQRKCVLDVDPAVLDRVVAAGYDAALGARALKRAVERQLTRPISGRLAALPTDAFTAVRVFPRGGGLAVQVQALAQVPAEPAAAAAGEAEAVLAGVEAALARIEAGTAALRPAGAVTLGRVRPEEYRYYALRDQVEQVRRTARRLREEAEDRRGPNVTPAVRTSGREPSLKGAIRRNRKWDCAINTHDLLGELAAAQDINDYLREAFRSAPSDGEYDSALTELRQRVALLDLMARAAAGGGPDRVLVLVRPVAAASGEQAGWLAERLCGLFDESLGLETEALPGPGAEAYLLVRGGHAEPLVRREVGTHLFAPAHANLALVQVMAWPLEPGDNPTTVAARRRDEWQRWLADLGEGRAAPEDDPWRLGPVVRVYPAGGALDLRTGQTADGPVTAEKLRRFTLAGLPVPPELRLAADQTSAGI